MGIKYTLLILSKRSLNVGYDLYGLWSNCANAK
ncbi:hypothetical protein S225a_00270 [Candidatus Brocadiaceae bacterium S225]|nr:hypothetical protein S225a_00270 [Candidatus Brocadiaceae bacterium S225]